MAHERKRSLVNRILRQSKFWPVTIVLGPRQTGKSTLLRDLLYPTQAHSYVTFDDLSTRRLFQQSPERMLQTEDWPLIIDEAHKVPEVFDQIKSIVDRKKIPGRFILSGSVRFTRKVGVRESLTGRAIVHYLDPLTIGETESGQEITLAEINRYLIHGGMPGVCFIRNKSEISNYWEQWIETTCERDILQFGVKSLSGDIARLILEKCCTLDYPSIQEIAQSLKVDGRRVRAHVDALLELFVLRKVMPSETGKEFFLPFDVGLAEHLNASIRRKIQTWFLTEFSVAQQLSDSKKIIPAHYLTRSKSFIDFKINSSFVLFEDSPFPEPRTLMSVKAALKKNPKCKVHIYCATESKRVEVDKNIFVHPWRELSGLKAII